MLTKYSQHEKSNDLGYFRTNELLYFQKFAYSMLQLTDRKGERAEGRGSIPPGGRGSGGRGTWWPRRWREGLLMVPDEVLLSWWSLTRCSSSWWSRSSSWWSASEPSARWRIERERRRWRARRGKLGEREASGGSSAVS
jgi:hypothetical protein